MSPATRPPSAVLTLPPELALMSLQASPSPLTQLDPSTLISCQVHLPPPFALRTARTVSALQCSLGASTKTIMPATFPPAAAKSNMANLAGTARTVTATTASLAALFRGTLSPALQMPPHRPKILEPKICFLTTKPFLLLLPRTVKRGLRSRHLCRGPSNFAASWSSACRGPNDFMAFYAFAAGCFKSL